MTVKVILAYFKVLFHHVPARLILRFLNDTLCCTVSNAMGKITKNGEQVRILQEA